jgi:preprotein translocase subunit SecF
MIEIFKETNFDFLGKKWFFIGLSWLLIAAGLVSVLWRAFDGNPNTHPFNMGVDFAGGTMVNVKFKDAPNLNAVRAAIEKQGIPGEKITLQPVGEEVGQPPKNEVLIRLPQDAEQSAQTGNADVGKQKIQAALNTLNDASAQGKTDLNALGREQLREALTKADPLGLNASGATSTADTRYAEIAGRVVEFREKNRAGLLTSMDDVAGLFGQQQQLVEGLKKSFFTGAATIRSTDAVSAQVGSDLQRSAVYVTLAACVGMLLFVAFRFKSWGFGIGAVIAVVHDVLVTLGIFSITQLEVNLTVIAALLTLVGYSMNDTIVIFDRIREMMKMRRRESLEKLSNDAINQTLSRTIITSGLTFLTVMALVAFGGEVLKSFSWCLFIGIIIGTYSSIYIASPFMLWWEGRNKNVSSAVASNKATVTSAAEKAVTKTSAALAGAGSSRSKRKK